MIRSSRSQSEERWHHETWSRLQNRQDVRYLRPGDIRACTWAATPRWPFNLHLQTTRSPTFADSLPTCQWLRWNITFSLKKAFINKQVLVFPSTVFQVKLALSLSCWHAERAFKSYLWYYIACVRAMTRYRTLDDKDRVWIILVDYSQGRNCI